MALNSEEYKKQRVHMIKLQNQLIKAGSIPTCTNCEQWTILTTIDIDAGTKVVEEHCQRWKMRPPAEVIVTGCPEWLGTIPF